MKITEQNGFERKSIYHVNKTVSRWQTDMTSYSYCDCIKYGVLESKICVILNS